MESIQYPELDPVMKTLVLPLYGRAECAKKYPRVFPDPSAERLVSQIGCHMDSMYHGDLTSLTWALRKRILCERVRNYLKRYPCATIVNLGCGADESFSAVDNGSCRWVNLDLPEVIAEREKMMPLRERESNIAMSAFDLHWLERIEANPANGLFVICGGMLMYFAEEIIRPLFIALAERFSDGGICFDTVSRAGMRKTNRLLEKSSNQNAEVVFAVDDAQAMFKPWSDRFASINILEQMPDDIIHAREIPLLKRRMLELGMKMGIVRFIEIRFRK